MTRASVDGGALEQLRRMAGIRRAARRRVADAVVDHGPRAAQTGGHRAALRRVTSDWAAAIGGAAAAGHPIAEVARAAGVAPSSIHYRLHHPTQQAAPPAGLGG